MKHSRNYLKLFLRSMRMKIEKLLIKNFKNIQNTSIINFDKNISLLIGPNGFGKTTIFDAIELALTGTINHVLNKKIVDGRSTFEKPYFQNNPLESVIIQLILNNNDNQSIVIVREYDPNELQKNRSSVPENLQSSFKSFVQESNGFLDTSHVNFESTNVSQQKINDFMKFNEDFYKIENIYNLFNYVQQDNSTAYLQKNETSRKKSLDFLLKVGPYNERISELQSINKKISRVITKLQNFQDHTQNQDFSSNTLKFMKLPFAQTNSSNLNSESFTGLQLEPLLLELNKLENFKSYFSPFDFRQFQKREKFQREIKSNEHLKEYILFRQLLKSEVTVKEIFNQQAFFTKQSNYINFILKNIKDNFSFFKNQLSKQKKISELSNNLNGKIEDVDINLIKRNISQLEWTDFTESWQNTFEQNISDYFDAKKQVNMNNSGLSDIIKARELLIQEKLPDDPENCKCILCGNEWRSREQLLQGYEKVAKILEQNSDFLSKDFTIVYTKLTKNINQLKEKINDELKSISLIDVKYIEILDEISEEKDFSDFFDFVTRNSSYTPLSVDKINEAEIKILQDNIYNLYKTKAFIHPDLFNKFKSIYQNQSNFEKLLLKYDDKFVSSISTFSLSNELLPITGEKYDIAALELNQYLEKIVSQYQFDSSKITDSENIYGRYFDNREDLFKALTEEAIENKREYILKQFDIAKARKQQLIEKRLKILKATNKYLTQRINKLKHNLTMYQNDMINKIKLPFFVYSAKILQNYQQGMGVLLSSNEGNANIRFLTSDQSDQDAMYQLSAGQVAVISFAFTLALNTSFNISENLNILTIDDPIQDMDSMNVYALIDLLRHAMLDYQIIIATHSDTTAWFMKYKFDIFSSTSNETVSMKNVKKLMLDEKPVL